MSLFKKNVENEVFEPPVFSDSTGEGVYYYDWLDEIFDSLGVAIIACLACCLIEYCLSFFI